MHLKNKTHIYSFPHELKYNTTGGNVWPFLVIMHYYVIVTHASLIESGENGLYNLYSLLNQLICI